MNIVLKNSENLNIKRNDSEFQILKVGKHIKGSSVTKQLLPWEHYVFEEVSSLAITLGAVTDNEINIFSFEFDSGSVPTALTLPSGMGYIGGAPTIEANAHYYFEIEKSYDGRYFCKHEKYVGGGSYIYPGSENITITYSASEKLTETTSNKTSGLHTNAFNANIVSHDFANGVGTIIFDDDITALYDFAFYSAALTQLALPSTVGSIGNSALSLISGSPIITIKASTPPTMNTQSGTYPQYVYVPSDSVENYKSANGWNNWAPYINAIPNND